MAAPIVTAVTICNSALLKLGAGPITALTQTSRDAQTCNALYKYLRDEVMGETPWRFALKRAVLYPNGTTPAFTYTYEFDIPQDCLRMLVPDNDNEVWIAEGTQILSNEPQLNMKYIFRNEDESTWDARFAEMLAWRLCMELALSLTQSIPMKQEAEKSYKYMLGQARSMNAVIGNISILEADIWTQARKGFRSFRRSAGQSGDP